MSFRAISPLQFLLEMVVTFSGWPVDPIRYDDLLFLNLLFLNFTTQFSVFRKNNYGLRERPDVYNYTHFHLIQHAHHCEVDIPLSIIQRKKSEAGKLNNLVIYQDYTGQ